MTLLVLAGGESRRMRRDKASLPVPGGTLVDLVATPLAGMFEEAIVCVAAGVSRPRSRGAYRLEEDEAAGQGPLRGILTGLRAAAHDACFVIACDMPGADPASVRAIVRASKGRDIAVAETPAGLCEPLFGVYRKNAIPVIEGLLAEGKKSVLTLHARMRVRRLKLAAARLPANINTPRDLRAYLKKAPLRPRDRRLIQGQRSTRSKGEAETVSRRERMR